MKEYEDLMKNTTQYAGYIDIDGHRIYGSLFIPDGVAHGYVVPNGVTVKKNASGVITNKNQLIVSNKTKSTIAKSKLEAFTQEKIAKGIFFPAAGSFGTYSDGKPELLYPGNRGIYWTADPRADTKQDIQAYSFVFGVLGPDYYLATVGNAGAKGDLPAKQDMYSIRPIYIGQ